ncbi:DUF5677 domain-containing protein [Dactylosporangium sp. CA-139066]|uniref:DUF5677 domain-containing protein n=1 Tax=Dactylosporangium sp. CA-139066 TaxID=3239930 RepID=UPI003D8C9CB7
MRYDEPDFLASVVEVANELIKAGADDKETAVVTAQHQVLGRIRTAPTAIGSRFERLVHKHVKRRSDVSAHARKRSLRAYWHAFVKAEQAIAAAEIINREQMDSCVTILDDLQRTAPSSLGIRSLFGGLPLKCLLLTSLHARTVVLADEILHLLQHGFCEAAEARARTLYETTVTIWVLASAGRDGGDNFEFCERYYVSSLLERRRAGYDREDRRIAAAARRKWGNRFFTPYGWARPLFPNVDKITFGHLEKVVESDELRPWYLRFNNAVHSGAHNTISRSDFQRTFPNPTTPEYEPKTVQDVAHVTLRMLELATFPATNSIAYLTNRWDDLITFAKLAKIIDAAVADFRKGPARPEAMLRGRRVSA